MLEFVIDNPVPCPEDVKLLDELPPAA